MKTSPSLYLFLPSFLPSQATIKFCPRESLQSPWNPLPLARSLGRSFPKSFSESKPHCIACSLQRDGRRAAEQTEVRQRERERERERERVVSDPSRVSPSLYRNFLSLGTWRRPAVRLCSLAPTLPTRTPTGVLVRTRWKPSNGLAAETTGHGCVRGNWLQMVTLVAPPR